MIVMLNNKKVSYCEFFLMYIVKALIVKIIVYMPNSENIILIKITILMFNLLNFTRSSLPVGHNI